MNLFSRLFLSLLFTRPHATHVYTKKIVFVSWSLWSSFLSAKTITKYIEKWMKVMYSPSQGIWNLYRKTFFFFNFSWRLITLQYCSGFCHTFTWISHGWTCAPHPEPPSHLHPSGSSQCTSPEHPVSCIEPGLVTCFTYANIHVSMLFSQITPPLPSPTESKRLFYTSVSLLLSRIQGYHYQLDTVLCYSWSLWPW